MLAESQDLKKWLTNLITETVNLAKENSLHRSIEEKVWDQPLIGFSNGDDPYYPFLKKDIGEFVCTPVEVFKEVFPNLKVTPADLTVITWVLPHTRQIKSDQRKENIFPSERWSRSRQYGEAFNNILRGKIAELLTSKGYPAVAPMLSPNFSCKDSPKYGYASTWSERHAAFVCGLGTFGLSDGLITPVGKAVRFGSVVARINITPSKRVYSDHNDYCLFYQMDKCGKCIERCPAGAITPKGHDKAKCREYIHETVGPYIKSNFLIEARSCGLCQTKVPCESRIPLKTSTKDSP